jgi:hypothetical protein
LSAGASIAQVALAKTAALAAAFLDTGASGAVTEGAMPYADINALMAV